MASGKILYAQQDGVYIFKFLGEVRQTAMGSYQSGIEFAQFIKRDLATAVLDHVIIDLAETESIDSTHLGLIAQLGAFMRLRGGCPATIISPRERITHLLEVMGLETLFTIVTEIQELAPALQNLPEQCATAEETARLVLEAHRTLASLNDQNEASFHDLIKLLEQQVAE
ncbi:MAG: STAS domain-containing protein [Candidatus Hydrogenedentes bacterium]|nr:STAS domain-containing protein [Candidatus Hydrogenedentota bacterium]